MAQRKQTSAIELVRHIVLNQYVVLYTVGIVVKTAVEVGIVVDVYTCCAGLACPFCFCLYLYTWYGIYIFIGDSII